MKTCPMCCETVQTEARKCPHCLHFLSKASLIAWHPITVLLPLLIVLGAAAWVIHRTIDPGEDLENYRAEVRVTASEMKFGLLEAGPTVAVLGTIRNETPVPWKDLTVEVRFFDKARKLIDSRQRRDFTLAVPPRSDCTFKVSLPLEFDAAIYDSHEVKIISARDAKGFLQ